MKTLFIIAENKGEFEQWCLEKRVSPSSPLVKYIPEFGGSELLRGINNPEIISCGNSYKRKDIKELNALIRMKTRPEVKIIYVEAPQREVFAAPIGEFRKVAWRN